MENTYIYIPTNLLSLLLLLLVQAITFSWVIETAPHPPHLISHFCPCLVIPLLTIVQRLPISPRVKIKALAMAYKAICGVPLFPFDLLSLYSSLSWLCPYHTAFLADSWTFQTHLLHQPSPYVTPSTMFGPSCLPCPISFFSTTLNTVQHTIYLFACSFIIYLPSQDYKILASRVYLFHSR